MIVSCVRKNIIFQMKALLSTNGWCSEAQFDSLKLPIFDECKEEIEKARENVVTIEGLEKNAESYIYEYFEDIKRKVDIRREDLKSKIDKYSDEAIQSIERSKSSHIELSKRAKIVAIDIEKSKRNLDEFIKQFDTLEINETKFENIKKTYNFVYKRFQGYHSQSIMSHFWIIMIFDFFEFFEQRLKIFLDRLSKKNYSKHELFAV